MAAFGDYLKSAREAKKVSLEEIAESTRISVRLLEALEQEQFDRLPGGVFNFSFARQYARHVGLDEDDVVARLKSVAGPAEQPFAEPADEADDSAVLGPIGARLADELLDFAQRHRMTLVGGLSALLLLAGGAYVFSSLESSQSVTPASLAEDYAEPAGSAPRQVPTTVSTAVAKPKAPRSDAPIQLQLKLTDTVWVRVVADGKRVLEANLQAGDVRSIEANTSVSLIVGNAGGVSLALNGKTMPPIGPPGRVRRVYVSPTSFEIVSTPPKEPGEPGASSAGPAQRET